MQQRKCRSNELIIYLYGETYGGEILKRRHDNISSGNKRSYASGRRVAAYSHFFEQYWIDKGYTEEEAEAKVCARKKKAAERSRKAVHEHKRITNTQLEYYLNKGMSIDAAKSALKLRQATCSLASFKRRYGEELGLLKYNERNAKWLYTLEQKSEEEKLKIKEGRLKGLLSAASNAVSKEETFILDLLEQTFNITIDRQYKLYYQNKIYSFDR